MTQKKAPEGRYLNKCSKSWSPGDAAVPSNRQSSFNYSGTTGEELIHITQDEREWARLNSEFKYILDNQSLRVEARREGLKEGRAEGREEGLAEGLEKKALEIAQNALAKGFSIEVIHEITGLDRETIEKLQIKS